MKTKLLFLVFSFFVGILHVRAQITLSHHVDPVTVDVTGLACAVTNDMSFNNYFARVYNLIEFGIKGDSGIYFVSISTSEGRSETIKVIKR